MKKAKTYAVSPRLKKEDTGDDWKDIKKPMTIEDAKRFFLKFIFTVILIISLLGLALYLWCK